MNPRIIRKGQNKTFCRSWVMGREKRLGYGAVSSGKAIYLGWIGLNRLDSGDFLRFSITPTSLQYKIILKISDYGEKCARKAGPLLTLPARKQFSLIRPISTARWPP
jgi:hypothetical protein